MLVYSSYEYRYRSPSIHPSTSNWFMGKMLIHEMDDLMAELLNLDVYARD